MKYSNLPLSSDVLTAINQYELPDVLGFGQQIAPMMALSFYDHGVWAPVELKTTQALQFSLDGKVFHYAQEIFEGLKAYLGPDGQPLLFRPAENFKRFNRSAERMAMPSIDEDTFFSALYSLVYYLAPFIPQGNDESLYLRPVMIANESGLSVSPAKRYLFYILASPSSNYFSASKVSALIERNDSRAAPGGIGAAKTGGNYAASLKSAVIADQLGYQQTLWLDAVSHLYIEEFSGMNFFAVVDGELITPALTDTILAGVTRDTIIQLAREEGYTVKEEAINIDHLLAAIQAGRCSEVFACGTAAVITPIAELGEKTGERYALKHDHGPTAKKLRELLLSVQTGRCKDDFGFRVSISDALDVAGEAGSPSTSLSQSINT